jgi:hypothetical protein
MSIIESDDFVTRASNILTRCWSTALEQVLVYSDPQDLQTDIDIVFGSTEVGYRKVIIIQIVGKAADPLIDAQSLQKGDGRQGNWDAREFAKRVFVRWNSSIGSPLGAAPDPYVSNNLRVPRLDDSVREKRKSKNAFDATVRILERANRAATVADIETLLVEILLGLRRFLNNRSFQYPLPNRSSLEDTLQCLARFLSIASGGTRFQAVAMAIFTELAEFGVQYEDIRSGHINSADAAVSGAGDIEFGLKQARIAVEAKDRALNFAEVEASVEKSRIAGITELIFVVNRSPTAIFHPPSDEALCHAIAERQFSEGLNVYFEPFPELARAIFTLVGEVGRRRFLELVGEALEAQKADAQHRWAWGEAVRQI